MNITTLVFDLDETLMPEYSSMQAAFEDNCGPAVSKHGLDATQLAAAVRAAAKTVWYSSKHTSWARSVGVSSFEGMSGDFSGTIEQELTALHEWIGTSQYRFNAWRAGLAEFDVNDDKLAALMTRRLPEVRAKYHCLYEDALPLLNELRSQYHMAMLTNGVSGIQRGKIRATDIGEYFDPIIISSEVGIGKPDPQPYIAILKRLGAKASQCVMIGNSLSKDIAGANQVSMGSIHVRRDDEICDTAKPDFTVDQLHEIPAILKQLG